VTAFVWGNRLQNLHGEPILIMLTGASAAFLGLPLAPLFHSQCSDKSIVLLPHYDGGRPS
jgi:hypothetical protein